MKPKLLVKKTYTDLKEYERDWLLGFKRAGHIPERREGKVNAFAYNPHDPHNGPRCTQCGEGWCWHCTAPWDIEKQKCGGVARRKEKVRVAENLVLSEAIEILNRRMKGKPIAVRLLSLLRSTPKQRSRG